MANFLFGMMAGALVMWLVFFVKLACLIGLHRYEATRGMNRRCQNCGRMEEP